MKNKFIIVSPVYNAEEWINKCINSVKSQDYDNYIHCIIDDLSTDNTCEIAQAIEKKSDNLKVIKNTEKKYALKNIADTLDNMSPDDNDIVVILDGDDWLASINVLSKLNEIYNQDNCWMTYGSYMEYPSNTRGVFSSQIPNHIIEEGSYRNSPWMSSHLRTFRYKLWKNIDKNDFIYSQTNRFVKAAWDLAFMFPMLEMAGHKARYIEDILYIYNRQNPLNEDKINHPVQLSEEAEVRSKKVYKKIEEL